MTRSTGAPVMAGTTRHGNGSLAQAEVLRFRSRRLIQVLLTTSVVAYTLIVGFASATTFGKTTPEQLRDAQRQIRLIVEEQEGLRQQCLREPSRPTTIPEEAFCGTQTTAEDYREEDFLDKQPFLLAQDMPGGGLAVAAAASALSFVLGATYIGAEWSSRSMVALLFWEPRRFKVMRIKLEVVIGASALLGVFSQALWFATGNVMARGLGSTGPLPEEFYRNLFAQQSRAVVLTILTGLLGFALSNLLRNTGAALGVGFVYFAVLETAVRNASGSWQRWLLTDNAVALIQTNGNRLFLDEGFTDDRGTFVPSGRELILSNLHGVVVLGIVACGLVALSITLFQRRDLQ